jgi:hypothetical protein
LTRRTVWIELFATRPASTLSPSSQPFQAGRARPAQRTMQVEVKICFVAPIAR